MIRLCKCFFNNAKNPKGILGRYILKFMNGYAHKDLAEWALRFIGIIDGESILDIGCGGGGNLSRFLRRFPNSTVNGVDYSTTAVELSKKNNVKEIERGRCKILLGDVQRLPFDSNLFDIVTFGLVELNFDAEHFYLYRLKTLCGKTYKQIHDETQIKKSRDKILEVSNWVKQNLTRDMIKAEFLDIYGDLIEN